MVHEPRPRAEGAERLAPRAHPENAAAPEEGYHVVDQLSR